MKKTVAYILTLVLLLSAVLPVSAAAIEPAWSKADMKKAGMKKETILLQPMEKPAEVPAAAEIAAETIPAETAEYTAPQLNAENAAKTGEPLSGQCGENATWVFEDGVLTVSGTGLVENSSYYDQIPGDLEIRELIVESGIEAFCNEFCYGWPYLEKATLPETMVFLYGYCFAKCPRLKEVNLPSTLKNIDIGCFSESGIEEIVLPEGVEFIGASAFECCPELTNVVLPDSVDDMGARCFIQCSKLRTVQLSKNTRFIGPNTFENAAFVEIEIPGKVRVLSTDSFKNCAGLEKIIIPPSVSVMNGCGLDTCEKVTIYCWENTAAHLYALEWEIPYVLMEEPPQGDVYDLSLISNDLGTVKISTLRTTAGSNVLLDVIPNSDTVIGLVEVYYFSEEVQDFELVQVDDTKFEFWMPPCEVVVEVLFLDLLNPFWDVTENDYFYFPVLWARSMGITSGTSENTFSPNDPCTRGQVVTFLWRAAGEPKPESDENPFWDVHPGDYYYDAVLWAVENGITNGVRPGEFAPNDSCTRGQIVTFLWRAMGSPEPIEYGYTFADLDASQYYYNPVLWAVQYGVTNGTSNTTFSPMDICTRGQIVTFLFRALG